MKRNGNDGFQITSSQSKGKKRPLTMEKPFGVCIQLLATRIQKVDKSVPTATIRAAKKCTHGGTSLRPNSSTPRKPASRKNAVSPSYAINGARTSATMSE